MPPTIDNQPVTETQIRYAIGDASYNDARRDLNARHLAGDALALSEYERIAVYTWTKDTDGEAWFRRINRAMRGEVSDSVEVGKILPLANALQSGLAKLPPFEGVVYRGVRKSGFAGYDEHLAQFNTGDDVILLGFSAASIERDAMFVGDLTLVLRSLAGKEITGLSAHPKEREVLFSQDSLFAVKRVVSQAGGKVEAWASQKR
jgi:hypothetical protein